MNSELDKLKLEIIQLSGEHWILIQAHLSPRPGSSTHHTPKKRKLNQQLRKQMGFLWWELSVIWLKVPFKNWDARNDKIPPFHSHQLFTSALQGKEAGEAFSLGILLREEDNKVRFVQHPSGLPLKYLFSIFSPLMFHLLSSHSLNTSYTPDTESQWLCNLTGRTCRHKRWKVFLKYFHLLNRFPLPIPILSYIALLYSSLQSLLLSLSLQKTPGS